MTTNTIDWEAAVVAAEALGIHTRRLVATRDADAVGQWALRMASIHGGASAVNGPRAASYYELAALVGHDVPAEARSEEPAKKRPAKEAKPNE